MLLQPPLCLVPKKEKKSVYVCVCVCVSNSLLSSFLHSLIFHIFLLYSGRETVYKGKDTEIVYGRITDDWFHGVVCLDHAQDEVGFGITRQVTQNEER
mmetsp:Transcript_22126/g.33766  ORF Transcript_22126/g.33766 Transcript_22126/m.33766 type:complete len:98 (+) Transcript_22126:483-776(+)